MLTEDAVRASDKRAQFIGIDAYVEAGGAVMRDMLEARGWVEKHSDRGDRRTPRLSVTDTGRTILVESCEERTKILMTLMNELSDEAGAMLNNCLRKLSAAYRSRSR